MASIKQQKNHYHLPVLNRDELREKEKDVSFDDLLGENKNHHEDELLETLGINPKTTIEFNDTRPVIPTVTKEYVSYSELATWMECSFRHKLKYIDGLTSFDGPSEHTEFGQVIHDAMESFLKEKKMPDAENVRAQLVEHFSQLDKAKVSKLKEKDWHDVIKPMLLEVPGFLDKTFPNWEFVASEFELMEPIDNQQRKFKGFIDGIIRVPKEQKIKRFVSKKSDGYEYWIIDWKSTSWGWRMDKKKDSKKIMQLALYKHFWGTKLGVNPKDIRCAFILLKRTPKKGEPMCELVAEPVGEVTVEKALEAIHKMLASIKKGWFTKNREACKYCAYRDTEHCT